ncbi:methionyl-tRNA formyltransferase [bacterium]|nr:methionyl-tRNA formyltransferase [bacterium]MCI0566375.1 methionyl-tRNA formyltransferase [bacterium]MCI0680099.1 methionyl-tRNA formyltransferase [bacterium]
MGKNPSIDFLFFGTDDFAVGVLEELKKAGLSPSLIVTSPDKRAGRGMKITPPPVKRWGESSGISVIQPEKLDEESVTNYRLKTKNYKLFIVASYGKIIPKNILEIPEHGALNVHPSLLPQYRGSSPIESAILGGDTETGVSIMLMDEKIDHGPILAQEHILLGNGNDTPPGSELRKKLASTGGRLLAETIPEWIAGKIEAKDQNHAHAAFTRRITKEDALINLSDDAEMNLRKIRAYDVWPGAYFFVEKNGKKMRVKITEAHLDKNTLVIDTVIPEGKNKMPYEKFKKL